MISGTAAYLLQLATAPSCDSALGPRVAGAGQSATLAEKVRARAREAHADLTTQDLSTYGVLRGPDLEIVVEDGRSLAGERRFQVLAPPPGELAHRADRARLVRVLVAIRVLVGAEERPVLTRQRARVGLDAAV
jgi:hypothetical protein